jgi:hypothetical protein
MRTNLQYLFVICFVGFGVMIALSVAFIAPSLGSLGAMLYLMFLDVVEQTGARDNSKVIASLETRISTLEKRADLKIGR